MHFTARLKTITNSLKHEIYVKVKEDYEEENNDY